jgi:hypothetical protein
MRAFAAHLQAHGHRVRHVAIDDPSNRQDIPANLRITASWGGRFDHLIPDHFPRSARVVQTAQEACNLGLPLDFDDSYAYQDEPVHFAHLVHGWQPKGSDAANAINQRRAAGEFTGYGASNPHRSLTPSC